MHCVGKVLFILAFVFLVAQWMRRNSIQEHFDFCTCVKDAQTGMVVNRSLEQECRQECLTGASNAEEEEECNEATLEDCKLTPTATAQYLSQIKLIKNV